MAARRRRKYEFKPDPKNFNLMKVLHLTKLQRLHLLKWTLYGAVCLLLLLIQDVLMSRIHVSGATTDLVPCAILLIGVVAGSETGGLFALIASSLYYFSGSAPGTYVIALLSFLVVGAALLRQSYFHRSFGSTMFCAGAAMLLYEMGMFLIGIFMGRTYWARAGVFFLTGVLSLAVMAALYPLVNVIGKIGGETWKE